MKSCQACSSNTKDRNIKAAHGTLTFCLYVTLGFSLQLIAQLLLKYSYLHLSIHTYAYQYTHFFFFFSQIYFVCNVWKDIKNNVFEIFTLKIHVHSNCGIDSKTKRSRVKSLAYIGHRNLQISQLWHQLPVDPVLHQWKGWLCRPLFLSLLVDNSLTLQNCLGKVGSLCICTPICQIHS